MTQPRLGRDAGGSGRKGRVLQGRYRLNEVLAEGGMGVVYLADRVGIERRVVVKFLHRNLSDTPGAVDRFEREARAMARLNHPNCVSLVDFGLDEGAPYLVMEFVEGGTLADVLDVGPLPPRRALHVIRQVLAGLAHAHARGILHRDLKPANVMIVSAVETDDFVKILDFGLAKLLGPEEGQRDVTVAGIAIGTPGSMSPEQASGMPADKRSDIYNAGALLYHLVTGRKAFSGENVHSVLRQHREETPDLPHALTAGVVSQALEDTILKAMAVNPAERYATAEEMIAALRTTPDWASLELPVVTMLPSSITHAAIKPPPPRRSHSGKAFVVGALLGLLGGIAGWMYIGDRARAALDWTATQPPVTPTMPVVNPAVKPAVKPEVKPEVKPVEKDPPTPVDTPKPTVIAAAADLAQPPEPRKEEPDLAPHPVAAGDDPDDPADDLRPPRENQAVARPTPKVSSLAEVRALEKRGQVDSAISGLYQLRHANPPAKQAAEIAVSLGNLYVDRRWWSDALREYGFACKLDPRRASDAVLIRNTIRALGDAKTARRAHRLLVDEIGRAAIGPLRAAAKSGTPEFRRRVAAVLPLVEKRR